jgi:rhodanese-related sulfurtransferase
MPAERPVGVYNVKLIVTNEKGETQEDTVVVKVIKPQFVANAGDNILLEKFDAITLDASKSYNLNGTIVSYEWVCINDNSTLYKGAESIVTVEIDKPCGTYNLKLIIKDENDKAVFDSCILIIEENKNSSFNDTMSRSINIEEFKTLQNLDKVYIDVRTPNEWSNDGIIEGSYKITKPYDIDQWLKEGSQFLNIVTDKNQSFTIICAYGSRAYVTSKNLYDKGYKHVHYLNGGIVGWKNAGEHVIY